MGDGCPVCGGSLPGLRSNGKPAVTCGAKACVAAVRRRNLLASHPGLKLGRYNVPRAPRNHSAWTWDGWTSRGLYWSVRDVTDEYGEQARYRRCTKCRRWLPEDYENFSTSKTDGPRVLRWDRWCRSCRNQTTKARRHAMSPEERHRIWATQWERTKADADRLRRRRYAQRAYRERDLERVRALERAAQDRYYARLKTDPVAYADFLRRRNESRRRTKARRAEEREADLRFAQSPVPARPLAEALNAWMVRRGVDDETGCDIVGISPRLLSAWRKGERPTVAYAKVDEILLVADLMWWEVYSEGTVRRPVLEVRSVRPVRRRIRKGVRVVWESSGVTWHGDAGPDLETLDRVRWVFEGDEAAAA